MNVKTMEGLAGASISAGMLSTPMSVVKEAERKGDVDKLERALGYAAVLTEQAGEYSEKTRQGMELDAREAKAQKEQQEERTGARRAEQTEQARRAEQAERTGETEGAGQTELGAGKTESAGPDRGKIGEEGRALSQTILQSSPDGADGMQDVTYKRSGETVGAAPEAGGNVDVKA